MKVTDLRAVEGSAGGTHLDSFPHLRAVVVGEAMLDVYRHGSVTRLSPEGPFPVLEAASRQSALGGAANVAANLAALGASVSLVSLLGDDPAAEEITALAREAGIAVDGLVRDPSRATLVKERLVGEGRTLLRLDEGTTGPAVPDVEARVVDRLAVLGADADLVVVADYRYGVADGALVEWLERNRPAPVVVVDSKQPGRFAGIGSVAVTSNYREVVAMLGERESPDRLGHIEALGRRIPDAAGTQFAAVTVDRDGVMVVDGDGSAFHVPASSSAVDACGGGDTLTAVMSLALASGAGAYDAVTLACRAAGIVVAKPGTAVCTAAELAAAGSKWCDTSTLARVVAGRRADGERIVLTNGCFDVLHAGHVTSLEEAARMGDVLVVAVNEDESVRRLKGPDRPVNPLVDRVAVLAGLGVVDYVVTFPEDTPLRILRELKPDVYCKGGDYRGRWIPEVELVHTWGGRFETTSYVADRSTSAVVERVRRRSIVQAGTVE